MWASCVLNLEDVQLSGPILQHEMQYGVQKSSKGGREHRQGGSLAVFNNCVEDQHILVTIGPQGVFLVLQRGQETLERLMAEICLEELMAPCIFSPH